MLKEYCMVPNAIIITFRPAVSIMLESWEDELTTCMCSESDQKLFDFHNLIGLVCFFKKQEGFKLLRKLKMVKKCHCALYIVTTVLALKL